MEGDERRNERRSLLTLSPHDEGTKCKGMVRNE